MRTPEEIRSSILKGLKDRKDSLIREGKLPLFEDGFYKGVEFSTLQTLILHAELIMNSKTGPVEAITEIEMLNQQTHLISHDLLGEGLNCFALDTMNKMIETFSHAVLKEVPANDLKNILSRYGVTYIPSVPKEKQN